MLFLASIWLDRSQPAAAPEQTYLLLIVYVVFAFGIAAVTWRHWWLDARLAAPAHLIDMAVFTGIVFSTNGYTSPFFLFFILPLLSSAIRWGWRETAMTAAALILLYLAAGLLVAGSEQFELQRFIVRSGHLLILSSLLIWFGIHQQATRLFVALDDLDPGMGRSDDPLIAALRLAMNASGARAGALLRKVGDTPGLAGIRISGSDVAPVATEGPLFGAGRASVFLFDLARNRTVSRRSDGWYRLLPVSRAISGESLRQLGATTGVLASIRTETETGSLVLWDVPDLSVDFLQLGRELGRAAGAVLERETLLDAIEEGVAARTRLSLARDVHDGVVQFLAGAAFRVEAMVRRANAGDQVAKELTELKRLLIDEQGEIRSFVSALRRDRELDLGEAVEELKSLSRRLSLQWNIEAHVAATRAHASIPIRLQFDLQQLMREAIANAVRHGGARRVEIGVETEGDQLRLQVRDDGSGFGPVNGASMAEPWSLKERVDRANGTLSLTSEPGCTNILITLPLNGASA